MSRLLAEKASEEDSKKEVPREVLVGGALGLGLGAGWGIPEFMSAKYCNKVLKGKALGDKGIADFVAPQISRNHKIEALATGVPVATASIGAGLGYGVYRLKKAFRKHSKR